MTFLLRYDTERSSRESMAGFLEKIVAVHRADAIPATFFCRGETVDSLEPEFRSFHNEVKDDPLFDIQDHSYTHIGVGYEAGKPVDVLKADYERSFAAHERVFGKRPVGVSICGTSGADGERLAGFDQTEKAKAEFEMLVGLGMKMINSFLTDVDEKRAFTNYARLGHPDVMGFPSAYSDTSWMYRNEQGDPVTYVKSRIDDHAAAGDPMPLMIHDWVAWTCAPDQELTHIRTLVDYARSKGYELATHVSCYEDEKLWRTTD